MTSISGSDSLGAMAAALLVGCSSPRAPVPESPVPITQVPAESVPTALPAPVAVVPPPAPAEIREPAEVACRISSVAWRSEQLRLRAGGPRFAQADGAPASVVLPVIANPSEAIESRGGQARILVDQLDFIVSGWVSQKDLGPAALRGYGRGYGGRGERAHTISRLYLMHCPTDVNLFVELGSERVNVGVIHKNSGFRVKPEDEAAADQRSRVIDLPESQWLIMEQNARLLVETDDLRACRQASPGF